MSRCISSHGEYSEHTFLRPESTPRAEDRFTCALCGDFDEWAAVEALLAAEAIAEAAREWVAAHDALVAAATFGADDSLQFAAERKAVAALLAAVDAERADREARS